jgi:hypothetical protein
VKKPLLSVRSANLHIGINQYKSKIISKSLIMFRMKKGNSNKGLNTASKNKKDEFYTQLSDIEREMSHYKEHFKDKVVFLNCDDPEESNFWKYFYLKFKSLGLKKLVATHYGNGKPSYKLEKINGDIIKTKLKQNGDFRSPECIEILKEADIIITNPPFSLFREFVSQLMEYNKKFIIIAHQNAISYKEIFKLIKENKMWLGYGFKGGASHFINKHYEDYATAEDHKEGMIRVSGVIWVTNLDIKKRHEDLILYKKYYGNEIEYPKYDNYDAINVNKTKDIPMDYKGVMGVPVTFMDKYNPDQFEIIGQMVTTKVDEFNHGYPYINGKKIYARILIKNKKL